MSQKDTKIDLNFVHMLAPFLNDIQQKMEYNKLIAEHVDRMHWLGQDKHNVDCNKKYSAYKKLADNSDYGYIYEKANKVARCCSNMWFNTYEEQGIKVLNGISRCSFILCHNCITNKKLTRLFKYAPVLDKAADDYDLYHAVFTLPNCRDFELTDFVANMHRAISSLIKLLIGENGIPRDEFKPYGIRAALRSSEITFDAKKRKNGKEFHPHLHVIFAFKKDLELASLEKIHIHDKYSYDSSDIKKLNIKRYFSEFELLLQKMWFLILNFKNYNKRNLQDISYLDKHGHTVEHGYSVTLDRVTKIYDETDLDENGNPKLIKNEYHEVFKYAVKGFDDNNNSISLSQLIAVYEALKGRRTMQGYGLWHKVSCDDTVDDSHHAARDIIEGYLNQQEEAVKTTDNINDVLKGVLLQDKYTRLNLKNIYNIENKDALDKFVLEQANSHGENLEELIERLKCGRALKTLQRAEVGFKRAYMQLKGNAPSDATLSAYLDTIKLDEQGNLAGGNKLQLPKKPKVKNAAKHKKQPVKKKPAKPLHHLGSDSGIDPDVLPF